MRKFLCFAVFFLILGAIIYYVLTHWNEFQDIKNISGGHILVLLLFAFLYLLCQGLILKAILEPFKITLKFKEWFGIIMVTLMGNYFIPFGGIGFRAQYLKKVHNFNYTHFLSTFATIYIIEFLIFTIGGIISLSFLYLRVKTINITITVLLLIVILGCILTFIIPPNLFRWNNKILLKVSNVLDSWHYIRANHNLLFKLLYLTLFEFMMASLMFYFAFQSFNFNISFIDSFLPSCLSDYSFVIRLTPASFGIYEGSVVYSTKLLGLTTAQGLLIVTVVRFITIFWIFTLGPIYSYILLKQAPVKNNHSIKC